MRAVILAAAALLAATAPAVAQDALREPELRLELEAARQRSIAQANQLMSLEARLGVEAAVRQVEAQRLAPVLPPPRLAEDRAPPTSATPSFAEIPADRLAASDARVRAAAQGR